MEPCHPPSHRSEADDFMSRPPLLSRLFRKPRPAARASGRWSRPAVEQLEDRLAPATLTVTTAADNNAPDNLVSLREAIESINKGSNFNPDVNPVGPYGFNDTINFAIAGTGVQSIKLG